MFKKNHLKFVFKNKPIMEKNAVLSGGIIIPDMVLSFPLIKRVVVLTRQQAALTNVFLLSWPDPK